jgi:hypothetical protein
VHTHEPVVEVVWKMEELIKQKEKEAQEVKS